jgi:hypothetical protein
MDPNALVPAVGETRIRLWCEGGTAHGTVINNRWLEVPCRDKRCKREGFQTVHVWDLLTGQRMTRYQEVQK